MAVYGQWESLLCLSTYIGFTGGRLNHARVEAIGGRRAALLVVTQDDTVLRSVEVILQNIANAGGDTRRVKGQATVADLDRDGLGADLKGESRQGGDVESGGVHVDDVGGVVVCGGDQDSDLEEVVEFE